MAEPSPHDDAPPIVPPAAPARAPVALATMALVLAAAALAGILYGVLVNNQLEARVKALETEQGKREGSLRELKVSVEALRSAVRVLSGQETELTNPALQDLRNGFAVIDLKLARKDTGVVVDGRLINTSSLRYSNPTFRIKVGSSSKEFKIGSLGPGASDEFEAELPNLPLENARTATFSLVSSAVDFAR